MASLAQQANMFHQALHAASDVVVGQHVAYPKRSVGRDQLLLEKLVVAGDQAVNLVCHSTALLPGCWAAAARIMQSVSKGQYTALVIAAAGRRSGAAGEANCLPRLAYHCWQQRLRAGRH
jgi:hypothetical protein